MFRIEGVEVQGAGDKGPQALLRLKSNDSAAVCHSEKGEVAWKSRADGGGQAKERQLSVSDCQVVHT